MRGRGEGGGGERERRGGEVSHSSELAHFLILEWQGSSCTEVESSTWTVWVKQPSNSCTTIVIGPCRMKDPTMLNTKVT